MFPILNTTKIGFLFLATASAALLLSVTVQPRPAMAGGIGIDCEGSAAAYAQQGIPCYCRNGRIVCDSPSGGSSSGNSSKKGLSSKNAMKLQMMQSLTDTIANAFIRWTNEPSKPAHKQPTPQEIAAQREKMERAKAEWRAKLQKQINEMEARYEEMKRREVEEKKTKLLAGMKGMDALQQLSCTAYWSKMADEALRNGDEKSARTYTAFAQNPDGAPMAECANALPQPPMPSSADEIRQQLFEIAIEEVNIRLPMVEEAKDKQREADQQVAEKQRQVDELKNRQTAAVSNEEKQAVDDLLAAATSELDAANAMKNEADAGLLKLQAEIDALNEAGKMTADVPK